MLMLDVLELCKPQVDCKYLLTLVFLQPFQQIHDELRHG